MLDSCNFCGSLYWEAFFFFFFKVEYCKSLFLQCALVVSLFTFVSQSECIWQKSMPQGSVTQLHLAALAVTFGLFLLLQNFPCLLCKRCISPVETVPPACCLALWCTYILCLSVRICECVCVGVLRKKVNRCVERRVLAARALRRRMQKCALFFFVVCTGINKQTKSTSFIFLAIFIVLEPCFFFFDWYKTTAQRQSLCLLKGDNVIINSGVCWTLLSCQRGLRKLQLRTRSPIQLQKSRHYVLKKKKKKKTIYSSVSRLSGHKN